MSESKDSVREHEGIIYKENRHGVERAYVRVDVGTAVLEVPQHIRNPLTERRHDLTKLSDDGYLKPFLALLAATNTPDHINLGSAPVLTFDKDRWERREMDGQHVLVKREAETKFEEMVLGDGRELHTGSDRDDVPTIGGGES